MLSWMHRKQERKRDVHLLSQVATWVLVVFASATHCFNTRWLAIEMLVKCHKVAATVKLDKSLQRQTIGEQGEREWVLQQEDSSLSLCEVEQKRGVPTSELRGTSKLSLSGQKYHYHHYWFKCRRCNHISEILLIKYCPTWSEAVWKTTGKLITNQKCKPFLVGIQYMHVRFGNACWPPRTAPRLWYIFLMRYHSSLMAVILRYVPGWQAQLVLVQMKAVLMDQYLT